MIIWTLKGGFQNRPAVGSSQAAVPSIDATKASKWLLKPYYLAPAEVWEAGTAFGEALSNESYLQMMLQSTMSYIAGYLNPAFQTGLAAKTPAAIVANYQATAQRRQAVLKGLTGDAMALGLKYGNLQVSLMHQVETAPGSGVSVWDTWTQA